MSSAATIERALTAIERSGLTPTEYRVLAELAERAGVQSALAASLDLPAVTVRRATRRLAMRGLIRRARGRRRNAELALTTAGLRTLRLLRARAAAPRATRTTPDRTEALHAIAK
jgi:DNA-binding MarR family transcriptional regulator